MHLSASILLTAYLNARRHTPLSAEVAARAITGDHTAHHVIDTEGLLGLGPFAASELEDALSAALVLVNCDWVLALPRSGRLAPLVGPPQLTALALDAGAVVIAGAGGLAWVPQAVGPAIQWQVVTAQRPVPVDAATDAERHLLQLVLSAARILTDLDLGPSERPDIDPPPVLPQCYGHRAQRLVARSWHLTHALDAALAEDGAVHLHGIETRRRTLTELRDAAEAALSAAVSWTGTDRAPRD